MTKKRILLIDDEEDIREVAQLSLEIVGGWQVITGSSGGEAVAKAEAEQPDAILLDVMMPEIDGFSTLKQLRANQATQQIPVIFLTAKVCSEDRHQFLQLGINGIITKPFDPMSLATQVETILGWVP
ncbi:MAG: response regulator [Okeania sp. SIO3B5]|uniref:response regulator n=1 Tax=Okeania sp. SIO3B5 TaxID=2607811 RepID=UPI0014009F60|nr:response regulator [Okeania sp. SIO3B5]NEO52272.1 response regulator [Okeania sp. SIO3B5]